MTEKCKGAILAGICCMFLFSCTTLNNEAIKRSGDGKPVGPNDSVLYEIFSKKPGYQFSHDISLRYTTAFRFTDEYNVNDLLMDISKEKKALEVAIYFSDLKGAVNPNTGLISNIDWSVVTYDKNMLNDQELAWSTIFAINADSVSLEELRIPYGLIIGYRSGLTEMLDFHNQRKSSDRDLRGKPTTHWMVWPTHAEFVD